MRIGSHEWKLEVLDHSEASGTRDYIIDATAHRAVIVDKGDSIRVAHATAAAMQVIYSAEGYVTPPLIDNNVTLLDEPLDRFPLWEDGLPPEPSGK